MQKHYCLECESEVVFHADMSFMCACDTLEANEKLKNRKDIIKKWRTLEQNEIDEIRESEKEYQKNE